MLKKQDILKIIELLKEEYPDAACSLDYNSPFELVVSARLSAQCTDNRVNMITKILFEKYKTPGDFAEARLEELEEIIRPCGLYKTKANDIKNLSEIIESKYNGNIPNDFDQLLELPGIGRKTANLIIGDVFGQPSVVADTHCIRLSNRLGLVNKTKDPYRVEIELKKKIPAEESSNFCHRLVLHGRQVCQARKPLCNLCRLAEICEKNI